MTIEKYKKLYFYGYADNKPTEQVRLEYREDDSIKNKILNSREN
jgi:hypothetical protein